MHKKEAKWDIHGRNQSQNEQPGNNGMQHSSDSSRTELIHPNMRQWKHWSFHRKDQEIRSQNHMINNDNYLKMMLRETIILETDNCRQIADLQHKLPNTKIFTCKSEVINN